MLPLVAQVATALLKRCAAAGLNLSEIGTIMSRPLVGLDEDPSDLEKMCAAAREDVSNIIFSSGQLLGSHEYILSLNTTSCSTAAFQRLWQSLTLPCTGCIHEAAASKLQTCWNHASARPTHTEMLPMLRQAPALAIRADSLLGLQKMKKKGCWAWAMHLMRTWPCLC